MSPVEFEDGQRNESAVYGSREILGQYQTPKLFTKLKNLGIVRTDRQAHWLLVSLTILCFLAASVVMVYALGYLNFPGNMSTSLSFQDLVNQGKIPPTILESLKDHEVIKN